MILFADLLAAPEPVPEAVREPSASRAQAPPSSTSLPAPRRNPWQRQGCNLSPEAAADPDRAIREAGLDWTVHRVDLRTADTLDPVPDFSAIRRSDNQRILGVVGADYEPFNNAGMFQVFKDLAAVGPDAGGLPCSIETAGAFQHGKVVWALAHLADLGIRIGEDESRSYLLVSNGHAGNRTLIIAPTTIRVVCQNTLRMAEAQARANRRHGLAGGFAIRHTSGIHAAVADAKDAFAATMRAHLATKEAWQRLAAIPRTTKLEREFLAGVFGAAAPDEAERARALRRTREERIAAILASPTSQVRGTKDSLFSLMHAVVEYVDHERSTRTSDGGDADENRLMSATFGSGAEVKARAWEVALGLAG